MPVLIFLAHGRKIFATLPLISHPESSVGTIDDFADGIAVGTGVARELGITVGDTVRLISPDGVKTAFGAVPRINSYQVVYIFGVGRFDIDRVRVYMPFADAQEFLNREGAADEIEIFVDDPEQVDALELDLAQGGGRRILCLVVEGFLRHVSPRAADGRQCDVHHSVDPGADRRVKHCFRVGDAGENKGRDIGILRTIGLSQGSVMRIFFICGASIGVTGTVFGVIFGCLFAINIDPIFAFVNMLAGGGVWDPSVRFLSSLPAKIEISDVVSAVALSLGLSFVVTIFPARRAARMNPLEALRYE